ncbi:NAD(P)-dependent oxidoreductase [Saccharopolyspora gloriosae]|uniref:NAD(P)-dependent oxidoreductase n=1 Tax=Saccharopolyspora gloriosae TaxID=455344 RepID=UPI001FB598C1|nr:NAD(P)-dependent oxidoreductase [Saccharopolyspora gloriosae]
MTGVAPSTVGLLHPGQMGTAVATQLRSRGHTVLWCSLGRGEHSRHRAEQAGLREVSALPELLDRCEVVLSVCPPAAALDVARSVAEIGYGGVYVDANAIAPETMATLSEVLTDTGITVVDGAIIGPPPDASHTARLYLAGETEHTGLIAGLLGESSLEPVELSEIVGRASALKMAFASFQKASRVLAAVAHSLADEHDVTDALLGEANRMSGRILSQRDYLPSVAARAWRWGPEMQEIARTLDSAGLPTDLADAASAVLARWDADRDLAELPTGAVLAQLRTP